MTKDRKKGTSCDWVEDLQLKVVARNVKSPETHSRHQSLNVLVRFQVSEAGIHMLL